MRNWRRFMTTNGNKWRGACPPLVIAKLDTSYRPIPPSPTRHRNIQPYRDRVNFLFRGFDMKAQLRNHVAALFLLAPVAGALTALPSAAIAQAGSPEVSSLQVTSDHGLAPGSLLHFRLEGTPRAKASNSRP